MSIVRPLIWTSELVASNNHNNCAKLEAERLTVLLYFSSPPQRLACVTLQPAEKTGLNRQYHNYTCGLHTCGAWTNTIILTVEAVRDA
jgi:hypothetical protein